MRSITLGQIAQAVDGYVIGDADVSIDDVTTDSRKVKSGMLYCAIVGQRVDGHLFIPQAVKSGAYAVLVSDADAHCAGVSAVVVPPADGALDPVIVALGKLAQFVRTQTPEVTVIGVTGSAGKTSTKDIIGQVLKHFAPTHSPTGSLNNELGLPLTILQAPTQTQFLVAEMGMRGLGHIAYLCDIAQPNIGVVTNVGHAHIGELGSLENIAKAKSELVRALNQDGIAVLNYDNPYVRRMAENLRCNVLTYGMHESADVQARNVEVTTDGALQFEICWSAQTEPVSLQLLGEHNVNNALAAAAVAISVGMPLAHIAQALSNVERKSRWRMEVTTHASGVTLINDAYNANPESMAAALKTLVSVSATGKTWAVLGAMGELGDESLAEHDRLGRLAVRLNIAQLVTVGQEAKVIHLAASQEGSWDGESVWFPDFAQATDYIVTRVTQGDVVLFKASRSQAFELLAQDVEDGLSARESQKGSQK